ncbi:MAG: adenylate/guanylate cyclase domain-containing protein [Rubrivivax sp.]
MNRHCHHCGADCRPTARFCDQCGTTLGAAPAPAPRLRTELRQGTLMFCDLVNSTRLANELDPDDLRQVFAAFQRAVREVIWRHSGYLIRFAGDGAFAVFGYPAAQEDSAESAVRAGLALVRAMRGETLRGVQQLQVRVGIASGPVVMGEMIGGAVVGEQSVTGAVAHLAARLSSVAAPDTVAVCDDTRRLIGQQFGLTSQGAQVLKGFPAPVPVWRVLAEGAPMSRFDAHHGGSRLTDLIGRTPLVLTLVHQWAEAAAGRGRGVLLLGEAGAGKSRVARALQVRVSTEDALHLDLHNTPRTQGSPLYPVGVLMRRLADVQPGDDAAACADKARLLLAPLLPREAIDDALRDLLPLFHPQAAPVVASDSPELLRQRMIDQLLQLVRGMAARRPVFLLVEDLHWADPSTLALLTQLLQDAPERALLLLATARADELPAATALPHTETQVLAPLTDDDARQLVQQAAAGRELPESLLHTIVQRGEGNALFLEELSRAAVEGGSADHLPGTLQTLVQARIDRLPALRPVVQAAAVLGREFRYALLQRLAPDGSALDEAVARLVDEGLLVPDGTAVAGGALRFKHALIHDAVYRTLLRGDRQRLHARAAELLMGEFAGSADASADQRAHHLAQAGRPVDAIGALLEASQGTAARAAYQESIAHVRRGIALLDEVEHPATRRPLELRLKAQLGVPLTALMGYAVPEVERTYQQAADLVDESTPAPELFPILRGLCTYYFVRGQMARADELAQQCLQLAERAQRADMRIDALSFAAYPAWYLGRIAEARRHAEAALALYAAEHGQRFTYAVPQDPATAAWAALTSIAWLGGDLPRADAAAQALLAHARALGRPFDIAYADVFLSASYQLHRRYLAALQHGQEGLALAQRHGLGTWVPVAAMQLCIAGGALAPSPEAIGQLQYVHQAFVAAGAEASDTFYGWGLAQAQLKAGDATAARATVEASLARVQPGRECYMRAELLMLRAAIDPGAPGAEADLLDALADAERQGALTPALRAAALLALRGGDAAAAERARAALAVIDGGDTTGLGADWVAQQLESLRVQAVAA